MSSVLYRNVFISPLCDNLQINSHGYLYRLPELKLELVSAYIAPACVFLRGMFFLFSLRLVAYRAYHMQYICRMFRQSYACFGKHALLSQALSHASLVVYAWQQGLTKSFLMNGRGGATACTGESAVVLRAASAPSWWPSAITVCDRKGSRAPRGSSVCCGNGMRRLEVELGEIVALMEGCGWFTMERRLSK